LTFADSLKSIKEENQMGTSPISSSSLYQQIQTYLQERRADLSQLGQALKTGNTSAAELADSDIVMLGQQGPFANGAPFYFANRDADFQAVGQALQSGDLSAARQAFKSLEGSFSSAQSGTVGGSAANTSPVSSLYQQIQAYFKERSADLSQLGQALKAGNTSAAEQADDAISVLGQAGPFANGAPFSIAVREQYFGAIGQALQSGDLSAAMQAFQSLQSTFQPPQASETSAGS
jgi:predicted lipoprotein